MKIMQINDTIEKWGGAEIYMYGLVEILKKNGHEVEIFGSNKFQSKLSYLTRFYDLFIYLKLSEKIKDFKPDVIHCHNIVRTISPSVLHAARKHKVPVVMTVHDYHLICPKTWFIDKNGDPCKYGFGWRCLLSDCNTFKRGNRYFFYHLFKILKVWLHRKIIKNNVNIFITPTENLSMWVEKSLCVNNVEVVPNFIDTSNICYKPVNDTKILLYIGRLSKEKGIEYLIKAIPLIRKKIPESKLIIVGTGPEEKNLKKLANNIGADEGLTFTGWVNDSNLSKYIQNAEIIVIPSYWAENFPLVTLEAMAHGRSVVLSDIFGLSERIENNDFGYFFEPGNSKDLADKLIDLLSNFELVKIMSRNARENVEDLYSPEKHYEKIVKIYGGLECLES